MTSAFDIVKLRWYFLFPVGFSAYFVVIASKNLQKSSAIQNISVTLASVIIAIFVCNSMYINTLKLQQISLITKSIDTYNSSNSRYLRFDKLICTVYIDYRWIVTIAGTCSKFNRNLKLERNCLFGRGVAALLPCTVVVQHVDMIALSPIEITTVVIHWSTGGWLCTGYERSQVFVIAIIRVRIFLLRYVVVGADGCQQQSCHQQRPCFSPNPRRPPPQDQCRDGRVCAGRGTKSPLIRCESPFG